MTLSRGLFAALREKEEALSVEELEAIRQAAIAEYLKTQAEAQATTGIIGGLIERDPFFVGRTEEQDSLLRRFAAGEKLLVITAPSGSGRTALVTEVLHRIAPHGELDREVARAVLIFTCHYHMTVREICVLADRLFDNLTLPSLAEIYDLYQQGKIPHTEVIAKLLTALERYGNVWLVFYNFEEIMHGEVVNLRELDDFFMMGLKETTSLRFLLASRRVPRFEGVEPVGNLEICPLPINDAKTFLRNSGEALKARGIDCGLAEASEKTLDNLLRTQITMAPLSLLSFVSYLETVCRTRGMVLSEVLADKEVVTAFDGYTTKAGAERLFKKQYPVHSDVEQLILRALSIFQKPVPPPILNYLLPALDAATIRACLSSNRLVRRIGRDDYALLPLAREVIEAQDERPDDPFPRRELHTRAADFYLALRKPLAECKRVEDFMPQFEEMHHCCEAEHFNRAALVLDKKASEFLYHEGYSYRMMVAREELLDAPMWDRYTADNLDWLARSYERLGRRVWAIQLYKEWLVARRKAQERWNEGVALMGVGMAHSDLGEHQKAIAVFEQALVIHREVGDVVSEGLTLMGLGNRYCDLGDNSKTMAYYETALALLQKGGNRVGEGVRLMELGTLHCVLGRYAQAAELLEQALVMHRENDNRVSEGLTLRWIGISYASLKDHVKGLELYEQALVVMRRVGDRIEEGRTVGNVGVAKFELGDKPEGIKFVEQALEIAQEIGDQVYTTHWTKRLKIMKG